VKNDRIASRSRVKIAFHGSGIALIAIGIVMVAPPMFLWMINCSAASILLCLDSSGQHDVFLFHVLGLAQGDHTLRLVVNGEKNKKSSGVDVTIGAQWFIQGFK